MEEIILKLNDEDLIEAAQKQFRIEKNKPEDFDFSSIDEIKEFIEFYVPTLFLLSDEQYVQLLTRIEEYMVELMLTIRPVKISKETALTLLKDSNTLLDILLEQNHDLLEPDFIEFVLSGDREITTGLYSYLNFDFVADAIIKKLETQRYSSSRNIDLERISQVDLSDNAKIKIFQYIDFSYSVIPEKFLNDEVVVQTLLKSEHGLPINAYLIPIPILEKYSDLVINCIREHLNIYIEDQKKFVNNVFQSDLLVLKYINSGTLNNYIYNMIPDSKLPLLESNIEIIYRNSGYYSPINHVTKRSKIFFEKYWHEGLEKFDPQVVVEEVEFLMESGFKLENVYGNSKIIFKNSQFIRKVIDYQIKNHLPLTAINYAQEDALENNILYAIENGFDYTKSNYNFCSKFLNFESVIRYLISKQDIEFLINNLNSEQVVRFEDLLEPVVNVREDNLYRYLLSSAKITKKILIQSNYDFSLLKRVKLFYVEDLSQWILLIDELCDMGFRLNTPEDFYSLISNKDLVLAYMKKSRDYTIIDKVNFYGEDISELVEVAVSIGYVLNENSYNDTITKNDKVIANSLLYGNIKYFDRIQRVLTPEETDLAYTRGYTITQHSSFCFCQNPYAFEKEFSLGNFSKIMFLRSIATDKMVQAYFDNGYVIDENTNYFFRSNPLAIHLMFGKTNDINVINLAIANIYREDFIKALEMGYVVNEQTPIGIINNSLLMGFYLEKKVRDNPNLKEMIMYLSKNDKLGINGTAASFDVILSRSDIASVFKDIELVKLVKFIYFSDDSKAQLLEIVNSGNISVLKNIYDICASLSNSSGFDIVMFKSIVINFANNEELCKNFITQDYTLKDVQLLYNFVVNGTLHDNEVFDLESLRNYKRIMYDKNVDLLNSGVLPRHVWLDAIFKLLCNKSYDEINILINQFFNVERIDELLSTMNNEELREELKNYRVFMELIEQIWNIEDIESLKKILESLNEQFLLESKDLELIWSNFKNITVVAKRFYGEEIKEKITKFDSLEHLETTQVVVEGEQVREDAKVIIRKGRYATGDYTYQGVEYASQGVDLIELNGTSFVSFAHVLNAYGSGATISDFKNPRLIGRTYICLSAIDEEKFGTVKREANDIDHVTLLFSNFSSDQLALASERDIGSHGKDNDLELGGASSNFRPVRNVISNTYGGENGYNEYVMYREDSEGNIIYPSAVLVTGDEPNEAEIQAAAYLGVPLVKINKNKYTDTATYDITPNDITPSNLLNKQGEWLSLKKSIEEIHSILSEDSPQLVVEAEHKKI